MALTKVTGQVILPTTDLTVGVLTVTNTLAIGGSVSIGGTLTYEDVTNIDSVGLITARNGINVIGAGVTIRAGGLNVTSGVSTFSGNVKVGTGITLSPDGDVYATGVTTSTIFKGTTGTFTGTVTANAFSGDGSSLTGIANTSVIFTDKLSLGDSEYINVGLGSDLKIYHNNSHAFLNNSTGNLNFQSSGNIWMENQGGTKVWFKAIADAAVELYHNNAKKFETSSTGATLTGDLTISDKIIHDGDTNNCIRFPAADTFTVETAGSERLRINSNGLFLLGHNTPIGNMGYGGSGIKTPPLQVVTADSTFNNGAAIINYRDGSGSPAIPAILRLALSRSDTKGGNGIVLNGDTVAAIQFQGNDGSNFRSVARIDANVDGAPGSDDMPGRLQFLTTSDGAYSPTERVRITSGGKVWVNRTSGSFVDIEGTAVNPDVSGGAWDGQVMIRAHNSATVGDGAGIRLMNTNGSKETAGSIVAEHTSAANGDLVFYTYSGGSQHWERMRISHHGTGQSQILSRVMIGRSDPIHNAEDCLTVYGGEDAGVAACFRNSGNGGGVLYYANNNNAMAFQVLNSAGNETFKVTGTGTLSKASGSFKIDHPLDSKKDSHYLQHSFIEGPQADLIYRGIATLSSGTATVNIDTAAGMTEGTFVALVTDVSCFTSNESDWTAVKGSVSGNTLTITAQDNSSTAKVSWLVIGERCDAHMKDTNTDWTDNDGKVIVELSK